MKPVPIKLKNNQKELRIVFMGTPDFAVAGLDVLLENNYNVVGVITAPDRPAGRGRKIQESAVKKFALGKDFAILQPTNLKDEDFLEQLKSLHANLFIVVAFRMLPKVVWQIPKYGTFNLHASLLPEYRGAAPINWAIINGETKTGVTTFFIDEKIDTGGIILQEEVNIRPTESAGELHDKLMQLGAGLILQTVKHIEKGDIEIQKQSEKKDLKKAPKLDRDICQIDWNSDIDTIYNHIRGLSPYPAAWTTLYNEDKPLMMKIFETVKEEESHQKKVGSIIPEKKIMKVAVNGGYLHLKKVQLQGKRKMTVQELMNGLQISKNAYLR